MLPTPRTPRQATNACHPVYPEAKAEGPRATPPFWRSLFVRGQPRHVQPSDKCIDDPAHMIVRNQLFQSDGKQRSLGTTPSPCTKPIKKCPRFHEGIFSFIFGGSTEFPNPLECEAFAFLGARRQRVLSRCLQLPLGFGSRRGCHRYFLTVSTLDARRFTSQIAQVIQPRAPHFTLAHYLDRANRRRMQRKNALDTHAKAHAAHCERRARSPALLRDHHALKGLQTLFFLVAFAL